MSKIANVILMLTLLSSMTYAKKTILGKTFEKVILHGVDKILDDLDKGEQSKIINYYQNISNNNEKISDLSIKRRDLISRDIKAFSINGITIIIKYPLSVRKGESFIIEARMINETQDARMGGLTLSFPQYISLDGTIIDQKFDSVKAYAPPEKMYSSSLDRNVRIKYFVIEGWENKWAKDSSRFIKLKLVAPKDSDELVINIRGVLIVGSKKFQYEVVNPTYENSKYIDQQGFYVKKIFINLRD